MLENKVAVITGAGRGLGREHALLFASLGAKVMVNDPGVAPDGSGDDASAADLVVAEIIARGGEAVASRDDVAAYDGAKAIIDSTVDAFGDLHIVINNAGILRDRMLVSMSEPEFDDVIDVHLKGTFNMSRHAATFWRSRTKAGDTARRAIVNTSSGAGLHGNVGQTNYAAAKAGIAAMTIVHALELQAYGAHVNCIAPVARTRLTLQTPGMGEVMGGAMFDPGHVSPLAAYLASDACVFNGQVFSVIGGTIGIYGGWSIADQVSAPEWSVDTLAAAMETLPRTVPVNSQMAGIAAAMSTGS